MTFCDDLSYVLTVEVMETEELPGLPLPHARSTSVWFCKQSIDSSACCADMFMVPKHRLICLHYVYSHFEFI